MEVVYRSVTDRIETWSIVEKGGVYHFRGPLLRCDCGWSGCEKIRFPYEEVADLYSEYQFIKYDRQHTEYWSEDCGCWHLRTSHWDDPMWS